MVKVIQAVLQCDYSTAFIDMKVKVGEPNFWVILESLENGKQVSAKPLNGNDFLTEEQVVAFVSTVGKFKESEVVKAIEGLKLMNGFLTKDQLN